MLDNYITVSSRIQMARKKLPATEGWCIKAFPQSVSRDGGFSIHVGQICHNDVLICQNIAVMQLPDPSFLGFAPEQINPNSSIYQDAINATLAKGDTVALGRTLVLAGFPIASEDEVDALLKASGLADDVRELIPMPGFGGEERLFEPTMSRLARFRASHDIKDGWGIVVDAVECDPGRQYEFQASIIRLEGDGNAKELAVGAKVWLGGAESSYLWKEAETLATQSVGRALAYLGFVADGAEMATADEMFSVPSLASSMNAGKDDTAKASAAKNGSKDRKDAPSKAKLANVRVLG